MLILPQANGKQLNRVPAWETRKQKDNVVGGLIFSVQEALYNPTSHLNVIDLGHLGNSHSKSP